MRNYQATDTTKAMHTETGALVTNAELENVKAYGCAYPPQKVGKDWLIKHVTVHAPPHQSLI